MDTSPVIILATINAKWIHPSLALRLLKANLGELEKDCEILEFALRQPLHEKVGPILAARPRILGISVSIWNHLATLELLKTLNENWDAEQKLLQRPIVVLGGPEVSWLSEEAEIFRYADYVIRGEGEESFRSLCRNIFFGKETRTGKSSTGTEKDSHTVFINQGNTAVDVNTIASPYRLYTDEDLTRKLVYVEASRGCPFGCEFCQASRKPAFLEQAPVMRHSGDEPIREFPLEPFLADMKSLINRGGRTFKFLDRTFNLDMTRVKRIMEFFLVRIEALEAEKAADHKNAAIPGKPDRNRPLCVHFEMVPLRFPPELKELIRRFPPGSLRIELGIQTFNTQTAALIHRAGSIPEEIETLEFLRRETGAIVHADLIAGLPGEDPASFEAGFDRLWMALSGAEGTSFPAEKPFEIQLGILKCLPGAPITRHNEAYKMRYDPNPPYEVIETGAMPKTELDRIKNFARFWELIVNRNPFPEMTPNLVPPGKPVFGKFMLLSDRLLEKFGRNWGIDRTELRLFFIPAGAAI